MAKDIDSFEQPTTRIGRHHAFYKVIIGDFNAKVGPGRTPEEFHIGTHVLQWNDQGERLSMFIMTSMGTRNSRNPPLYAGRGSHPVESTVMK
ncbi:hypothetical protein RB195_026462 [Necator americanus]|uniref:Endonuclease/exonuclease/phosphatase domain-containing protein n=1 Tax=Necator americanus TaxID=51031 RepID=A0ABR1EX61_NECAM